MGYSIDSLCFIFLNIFIAIQTNKFIFISF